MITVELLREGGRTDYFEGEVKVSKACCSAVVLIRAGKRNIVVDPGAMGYAAEVVRALAERGLMPSDIDTVVNTHMHLDHTYNNYLFPNALIYTPTSVWHSDDGNRVEMYPTVTDLGISGVVFLDTPGHMEKHISVLVESGGKKTVIAGDAVRESVIADGIIPKKYPDGEKYLKSMKRIFGLADEIIPGHGPIIKGKRLVELRGRLGKIRG
jgi:glyoxylase-like metal-dependent hydrolase (beta-lactamase superfamily II)